MQNANPRSISRYIYENLISCVLTAIGFIELIFGFIVFVIQWAINEITAAEQFFLLMTSLYTFISQFFFFTLCNLALLNPSDEDKGLLVSSLTTLLLYSIFTYFATRIKDTFQTSVDRTRTTNVTRGYVIKIVKVLLEFAKATVVILCLKEQGLRYNFDVPYTIATFTYFVCTEKLFVGFWIFLAQAINTDYLDSLEHLYIPIILHILIFCLIIIIIGIVLATSDRYLFVIISSYFILFLPVKNVVWNYINPLLMEKRTFASFRVADARDLEMWDDICAVCLDDMSRARITPCNHLFHPKCLKRCLQSSMNCPLCKKSFLVNNLN